MFRRKFTFGIRTHRFLTCRCFILLYKCPWGCRPLTIRIGAPTSFPTLS